MFSIDVYLEKYLKKLIGNMEIEDALQRLDRLTLEEAHMAAAELLRISHNVESGVVRIDEGVQGVSMQVQNVGDRVEGVDSKVQDVDRQVLKVGGTVQNVDKKVQEVGDMVQGVGDGVQGVQRTVQDVDDGVQYIRKTVQGVDDKVDRVNRELSLNVILLTLQHSQIVQGFIYENAFNLGSLLQIHLQIITLHAMLNMKGRRNGSSVEPFSINGNPRVLSCGFTGNVCFCYSRCHRF
jgi:archaellum component FlaC